VWGTLAVGLFASPRLVESVGVGSPGLLYGGGVGQLGIQALGVAAVAGWTLVTAAILFGTLKATVGLRVTAEEEIAGLDISEHGMWGYPESFLGPDVLPGEAPRGAVPVPRPAPSAQEQEAMG
jgi:Ammonia permease